MNELEKYLADDKASGRRAARHAAAAAYLRDHVAKGTVDNQGNSVETLIALLEKAAAAK